MQPGTIVGGRYEIEALAGVGGMGIVFRARDLASGSRVALKTLRSMAPRAMARFVEEAELLARLEHPCIVRYLSHGVLGDRSLYLALEWIDGEPLSEVIARRGLPVETSLRMAHRLAGALGFVHARGVVHADVKPTNVLLVGDEPKLADFGIARWVGADRPDGPLGTPSWMAPEQARGEEVDARADVFSLGALLLTCLTGHAPFENDSADERARQTGELPRLSTLRPDLPPALEALLASMLAPDRDARPASGAEVEAALEKFLELRGAAPAPLTEEAEPDETEGAPDEQGMHDLLAVREQRFGCAVSGTGEPSELDAVAAKHGATVDRLGDSFVCIVRGAGSATDLASRAAVLASALRTPELRLALAAGAVEREVVERALSLLRAREEEGIALDANAASLLEGRFEILGRTLGSERSVIDAPRRLLGRVTPFVGRAAELRALQDSFLRAIAERRSHAALVTGAPGIGKSRLRHELLSRLRVRTWVGEGDAMRFGTPFSLIAPLVLRIAEIEERDDPDARRAKLVARVERVLPGGEAPDVAAFLGEVAGVLFPEEGNPRLLAARQSPLVMALRVRDAFLAFVGAELAQGPLLVMLEDVHWGDWPSMRLVDQLLAAFEGAPLLVLAVGRPDVDRLFPELWSSHHVERLPLHELDARAARRLAREVLGPRVDRGTLDDVVARSEGNAFYLEEVIRAVAEGRRAALPETVLAMTQSRLDALPADARRVLRACSVFGDASEEAVLAVLEPPDPREIRVRIDDLIEREVLVRRTRAGRPRYSFRHALLRDGAYATWTEGERVLAHQRALRFLRGERGVPPLELAEHAERANDRAAAAELLLAAATEALVANDFLAAIDRATRGLEHGATGELRGALLVVQGQAHAYRNEWQLVVKNEEALELCPAGSAWWCTAAAGVLWGYLELGEAEKITPILFAVRMAEPEPGAGPVLASTLSTIVPLLGWLGQQAVAAGFLERLEEVVGKLSHDDLLSRGWLHLARAHQANFARCDTWGSLLELRKAVDYAARGGDRTTLWPLATGALGDALRALGRPKESEALQREVLGQTARALEFILGFSRTYLANAQVSAGDLEGAEATADEIVRGCGPRDRWREGAGRAIHAMIRLARGQAEEAEKDASRAIETLEGVLFNEAAVRGLRAAIRLQRGDVDGAKADALAAHGILDAIGSLGPTDAAVRLVTATALAASGDPERAASTLRAAVATLDRRSQAIEDPELRASFEAIPEHAQTRMLAQALGI